MATGTHKNANTFATLSYELHNRLKFNQIQPGMVIS